MRNPLLLAACLVWCAAATAQDANEYVSKDGGFAIKMPGMPKEMEQTVSGPAGPIKSTFVQAQVMDGVYFVTWADQAEAIVKTTTPEKMLDSTRDTVVGKGKLLDEKKIKVGASEGRELQVQLAGEVPLFLRTRIVLADRRIYQVSLAGTKDRIIGKEADAYLDSFKMTAK